MTILMDNIEELWPTLLCKIAIISLFFLVVGWYSMLHAVIF